MGAFLTAHGGDILVGLAVVGLVALAVRTMVRNKKAGKSCCGGCDGDCEHCGMHHSSKHAD